MKGLSINKRAISFLCAATITFTMVGCGLNDRKKGEQGSKMTSVTTSLSTTNPTLSSSTSVETTVATTIPTMSITTELTTVPTTQITTIPTTLPTTQPTTVSTTKSTTTKPSTKVTTTKPSTKVTTTKPTSVSTTQSTTKPKLTLDNINDIEAIDSLVKNPDRTIFVNPLAFFTYIRYVYDGQKYTCGVNEYRLFVALLNEQYITDDTLKALFGEVSEEEMQRYSQIFSVMAGISIKYNITYLYDNFVVNENMRNFLNQLQNHLKEYMNGADNGKINAFINSYYNGQNQYINHGQNKIIDSYIAIYCYKLNDTYENEYLKNISDLYFNDYYISKNYINNEFYQKTRIN